jgi:hypothetical protein
MLGTALGAVLVGGFWAATSITFAPAKFTLSGTLVLNDGVTSYPSPGCRGYRGYDDIDHGASVTVYDAKGIVIATGSLGQGALMGGGASCAFPIIVAAVPEGSDFYQVEVSHRGKISVQAADARAGRVAVSLGS